MLKDITKERNRLVLNTNKSYSQISNLASSIRIFNGKHVLYPLFKLEYARQRVSEIKYKNYDGFFNSIFSLFPILGTIFIIFFGSQEVVNQTLSIGALVGVNILNSRMFGPINRFSLMSSSFSDHEKEKSFKTNKVINENLNGVNPKIISGSIVLKNLSLGFSEGNETLFQRLNCTIPAGGIVVINGYNSAGKTSLCKAITGLIHPLKGSILFDKPSESLDNKGVFDLYKILNNYIKLKKTLIIASHDSNILKSANIVIDLSTKPIPRIGVRKKRK